MAKRTEQTRAASSDSIDVSAIRDDLGLGSIDQSGHEAKATEIIELAVEDLRLIASAFEIIDLSFRQFPDKFSQATSPQLVLATPSEFEDEDSLVILH